MSPGSGMADGICPLDTAAKRRLRMITPRWLTKVNDDSVVENPYVDCGGRGQGPIVQTDVSFTHLLQTVDHQAKR